MDINSNYRFFKFIETIDLEIQAKYNLDKHSLHVLFMLADSNYFSDGASYKKIRLAINSNHSQLTNSLKILSTQSLIKKSFSTIDKRVTNYYVMESGVDLINNIEKNIEINLHKFSTNTLSS